VKRKALYEVNVKDERQNINFFSASKLRNVASNFVGSAQERKQSAQMHERRTTTRVSRGYIKESDTFFEKLRKIFAHKLPTPTCFNLSFYLLPFYRMNKPPLILLCHVSTLFG